MQGRRNLQSRQMIQYHVDGCEDMAYNIIWHTPIKSNICHLEHDLDDFVDMALVICLVEVVLHVSFVSE